MTEPSEVSPELLGLISAVVGKRPKTVVDHILEHGLITSQELKDLYGYNHPPRAVRDVREQGVPIVTFRIEGTDGRKIAAYKFGDPADIIGDRLGGRVVIPKEFKQRLAEASGMSCAVCSDRYEERYLQADHRVPYQVSGDAPTEARDLADYMPLCASCNRAKSWSCEQCENWKGAKDPSVCSRCFWAHPEDYDHVAGVEERRVMLVWKDNEIVFYDELSGLAENEGLPLSDYLKTRHGD